MIDVMEDFIKSEVAISSSTLDCDATGNIDAITGGSENCLMTASDMGTCLRSLICVDVTDTTSPTTQQPGSSEVTATRSPTDITVLITSSIATTT